MEDFNIPGIDRGMLVAAFAGAVAYLCTKDKMPALRAVAYVVAGTAAAAYLGPGAVEYMASMNPPIKLGERAQYAVVFATGVGGIWILNIIVTLLESVQKRVGGWVSGWLDKAFGAGGPPTGGA